MNELSCISLEIAEIRSRMTHCSRRLAELTGTPAEGAFHDEAGWALGRADEQIRSLSRFQASINRRMSHGLTDQLREAASLWSRIGKDRGIQVFAHLDRAPATCAHLSAPLTLVANTALSNTFDHAFPAGRKGLVKIGLGGTAEGGICLTVIDDGADWHERPSIRRGYGFELINELVTSIAGRAQWRRHLLGGNVLSVFVPPTSEPVG